jgi:hypothetical protein
LRTLAIASVPEVSRIRSWTIVDDRHRRGTDMRFA